MGTQTTRNGARYARISEDQAGDEHGVTNQLDDEAAYAQRRDITVAEGHTYVDNDISATYGKLRPRYQAMMEAAANGEFDVIIVFHTSRLWRNRKERAEGIEILRKAGISVEATKGPSLDMSTAYGRGMAGLLGEFDTMETEVKSERQVLAAAARAKAGKAPLGTRLTGYTVKGEIIEAEAAHVREIFARFHSGDSLRGIAAWWKDSGFPTRHGRSPGPSAVRDILTNPRYKGTVIYNRHAGGTEAAEAVFPAIVDEGVWDAVNAKLADPRRRKQVGTDRKHLGSGLYLCGVCEQPVRAHGRAPRGGPRTTSYRCPAGGHVTRNAEPVDGFVLRVVRARLAKRDLAGLLAVPAGTEGRKAAAEIKTLRARLKKTEQDYDDDLIDGNRYKEKKAKLTAELDQAEAARARLMAGSEVAGVLTAPDPVAAFNGAPLGTQRAVVGFMVSVRLDRAPRGHHFSPASVRIDRKTKLSGE